MIGTRTGWTDWRTAALLLDVNVLVYAHRADEREHRRYAAWLSALMDSGEAFALPTAVSTGFLRVVTSPRIYRPPTPLEKALAFISSLRDRQGWTVAEPGTRYWELFDRCCRDTAATGNLIHDAHLAAIAIEIGAEIISTDGDFRKFRGLRWRHPFPAPLN